MKGLVNKIIPFSSVDGPGNRTAIFLQGCNFNCLYCHNPETINICCNCLSCVSECHYNALSMNDENKVAYDISKCKNCDSCIKTCKNYSSPKTRYMSHTDVLDEILKYKSFISGITVSGGECMRHNEFMMDLFREVKKFGLTCFIDTNGSIPFWDKGELLEVMDKAMVDLKSYDPEEHKMLTGMDNETVIKNIEFLAKEDKLFEVRTVIVPELLNNEYNVEHTSALIAKLNPDIRYKLIRYREWGVRKGFVESHTPDDEYMENLYNIAAGNGCKDIVVI